MRDHCLDREMVSSTRRSTPGDIEMLGGTSGLRWAWTAATPMGSGCGPSCVRAARRSARGSGLRPAQDRLPLRTADRAYVLNSGSVADSGTSKELLERKDMADSYLGLARG